MPEATLLLRSERWAAQRGGPEQAEAVDRGILPPARPPQTQTILTRIEVPQPDPYAQRARQATARTAPRPPWPFPGPR